MAGDKAKPGEQPTGRDVIPGFGAAVRARRESLGLTLVQLAAKSGSGFSAVSKIERGARAPSLRLAVDLASALGVAVDVLIQDAARMAT
jgi:XRE family transcriptional regulator, regulator of sulfur utilization